MNTTTNRTAIEILANAYPKIADRIIESYPTDREGIELVKVIMGVYVRTDVGDETKDKPVYFAVNVADGTLLVQRMNTGHSPISDRYRETMMETMDRMDAGTYPAGSRFWSLTAF